MNLIPSARQQVVDQVGDVNDGDFVVLVQISILYAERLYLGTQQVVYDADHVGDIHVAVAIHVARQSFRD